MNRIVSLLLGLGLAASALGAERLEATRLSVGKWVETRQLISKTKVDWQTDKDTLEQTINLFERELKAVEAQLAKLSTNSTQVDRERAEAESLRESSAASLDQARQFAGEYERKLAAVVPKLPAPLQDMLKPLLSRIPTDPATRMSAAERVQVIVGVLNEIDKFNNAVSVFSEKRRNATGEEIAVETVYVGLGTAYFVNDANDFAGTGTIGSNGWEWSVKPELAASVREVVQIYRNERPAKFVALPATVR